MSNREVAGVEKEKLGGWYGNGRWVCGCVRLCAFWQRYDIPAWFWSVLMLEMLMFAKRCVLAPGVSYPNRP